MENCIARAEHEEFAKRIDAENTRQNRRIEALEQSVDRFGRIASSVERLDKPEGKPGENWNVTVKSILTAIGSAIGGGAGCGHCYDVDQIRRNTYEPY